MKAIDRQFSKIVNGTTQFVIPVFQRDYRWNEAQCLQLWEDVLRVGRRPDDRGHFIGSFVYVPAGDTAAGFTRWLLIDGQQRLTTMTLLLLALRAHITRTGWKPADEDGPTAKRIEAYFLKNVQEEGTRQYKLMLRRKDQVALQALLDGEPVPPDGSSRIQENFDSFLDWMKTADPADVYKGIGRLIVVDVTLDRLNDDPQMVFESLNSTGVDLSQADLIRNFVLMRVPEGEQTRLYEKYWRPIEDLFRGADRVFDSFARDYMALHLRATKQVRAENVYQEFRSFLRDQEATMTLEAALAEMLRFARYYAAFILGRGGSAVLAPGFARLNSLTEVAAVLVMRLADCHERLGTLTEAQFAKAVVLLESYVFRRSVCGMQTRGYWQVFNSIADRLNEQYPLRSLTALIARQRGSYRAANDEEFHDELLRRDCYNMRTCHYLLDRLENHDNKEPTDTSGYSIEHVLPQNEDLRAEWKKMLGEDWRAIQATWLHRLGNLTLTGYNSTYSDRAFADKQTIPGGFKQSSVRLNADIRDLATWSVEAMDARGRRLAKQALTIWPPCQVTAEEAKETEQAELRRVASKGALERIPVSEDARPLFDRIRQLVASLDTSVIEVPRAKTVSYHAGDGDFFVELLPRKRRVLVLLNLELGECQHRDDRVRDATDYRWVANATNSGGVFYDLTNVDQLDAAMKLVRQAYTLAAQ